MDTPQLIKNDRKNLDKNHHRIFFLFFMNVLITKISFVLKLLFFGCVYQANKLIYEKLFIYCSFSFMHFGPFTIALFSTPQQHC